MVGVGLIPDTRLAEQSGLRVGNGIHVDTSGRTSNPAVWAAGDVASVVGSDGISRRIEHWQNAKDQGTNLARAVLGAERPDAAAPWFWSDQYDINIQRAGWPRPTDTRTWRGEPDALSFSVPYHRDGMVTGITAVNRGKDVRPAIELIRRGSALDATLLSDPATALKSLLKAPADQDFHELA